MSEDYAIVILAAGNGTRMCSALPKVLHKLAGISLLEHVLRTSSQLSDDIIVVVSEALQEHPDFIALQRKYNFSIALQKQRLGTGHAVQCALQYIKAVNVLVLYGDVPLLKLSSLQQLLHLHKQEAAALACLAFIAPLPTGYGRLITAAGAQLCNIVEEIDATPEQRQITTCNSGVLLISKQYLAAINDVNNDNSSGEYYLTSLVDILCAAGKKCVYHTASFAEVQGVNDKQQLASAEAHLQQILRQKAMLENGVAMLAPETVFLGMDAKFGSDVVLHPHVHLGAGVELEDGVEIKAFSVIEGAKIGASSVVGPFARIRPNTVLAPKVRIGNFVEVKNSDIKYGSKVNHLSYVGDASVGENTNIGAGTICCNYDGFAKHKTTIGDDVLVGANSCLVAPVMVADGAMVAAGSTIVKDVLPHELGIARSQQVNISEHARNYRARKNKKV